MTSGDVATPSELRVSESYRRAQRRINAAGRRARVGQTMRSAALDDIGAAIREHRGVLDEEEESGYAYRLNMLDLEEDTGISRRTISDHLKKTAVPTDQELAQEALAYGDTDRDCVHALHARYPELDGYAAARKALWDAADAAWDAQHPEAAGESPQPESVRTVLAAYWQRIQRIADGREGENDPLPPKITW